MRPDVPADLVDRYARHLCTSHAGRLTRPGMHEVTSDDAGVACADARTDVAMLLSLLIDDGLLAGEFGAPAELDVERAVKAALASESRWVEAEFVIRVFALGLIPMAVWQCRRCRLFMFAAGPGDAETAARAHLAGFAGWRGRWRHRRSDMWNQGIQF